MRYARATLTDLTHEIADITWAAWGPGVFGEFQEFVSLPRPVAADVDTKVWPPELPSLQYDLPSPCSADVLIRDYPRLALQLLNECSNYAHEAIRLHSSGLTPGNIYLSWNNDHPLLGTFSRERAEEFESEFVDTISSLARPLLRCAMEDPSPRIHAAMWMYIPWVAHWMDMSHEICESLNHPDHRVLQAVLYAWSNYQVLDSREGLEIAIVPLLDHDAPAVRLAALEFIKKNYSGPWDEALIAAHIRRLDDPEGHIRDCALPEINKMDERSQHSIVATCSPIFRSYLEHPDPVFRARGLIFLKEFNRISADEFCSNFTQLMSHARNSNKVSEKLSGLLEQSLDKELRTPRYKKDRFELAPLADELAQRFVRLPANQNPIIARNQWTVKEILRSAERRVPREYFRFMRRQIAVDVIGEIAAQEQIHCTLNVNLIETDKPFSKLRNRINTITRRICKDLHLPDRRLFGGWHSTGYSMPMDNRRNASPLDLEVSREPAPDRVAVQREIAALLRQLCSETLSDLDQRILELRYVQGLSKVEIGKMLGKPESTVRSRILGALELLRSRLVDQFDPTSLFSP